MENNLPYDRNNANEIEHFAEKMVGHSLKEFIKDSSKTFNGKGRVGQLMEKYYFGYEPNSNAEPDFKEAGVELKCTPMKEIVKAKTSRWVAKERLVLNIINYNP